MKIIKLFAILLAICMFFTSCANGDPATCTHEFGDWKITKKPDCYNTGEKVHKCKKCGTKETAVVEITHDEEVIAEGKAPTCTEGGYTEIKACKKCYKTTQNKSLIPALGHDFDVTPLEQSTLTKHGTEHRRCKLCGYEEEGKAELIKPEWINIPTVFVDGDIDGISKTKEKSIQAKFIYGDRVEESIATLKIQGNSSAGFEKKNYTIKFYKDAAHEKKNNIDFGWGKQHKYCLKANYVDYTHARNLVSCNIYTEIVKTRKNLDPNIAALPTYGMVDGFPIMLYINGEFHGLYTFNIPKDNWLYGMKTDQSKKLALLCADQWYGGSVDFSGLINEKLTGWDLEHCSTTDTTWVRNSFNRLIEFVKNNDGEAFRQGIGEYIDVNSVIDALIYTYAMDAVDNTSKNINYVTYDGKKWIVSLYDLDATWGLYWDGTKVEENGRTLPYISKNGTIRFQHSNNLYKKVFLNFRSEIKARYKELRATVLTPENIRLQFELFSSAIPEMVREADDEIWPHLPGKSNNNINQITSFATKQLTMLDEIIYNPKY